LHDAVAGTPSTRATFSTISGETGQAAPAMLSCGSTFMIEGRLQSEFDRFGLFEWGEARARKGKNLARILDDSLG
jgi:hypothetical protein